ncbi:MAG: MauE/DoxX family redox-associated membrane protein, partial [Bacteroidota bacterium]
MNIVVYIIRFLLAFLFIYAGIEKLFLPYDPSVFRTDAAEADPVFFTYYELLQGSGYLYFVGFFQLLCGTLLIFKRTYLLGSIMLVPLILCLLM